MTGGREAGEAGRSLGPVGIVRLSLEVISPKALLVGPATP